jgi:hypothetical protein
MNKDKLYSNIKQAFPKLDNKALNSYCVSLWSDISAWHREEKAKVQATSDAKSAEATSFSDVIQRFVDNPMTPDEEYKGLRAMLHAGIFTGDIPSNLLAVLEKTIGINSGEDDKIEVVNFKDAFPDMESAKLIAMKMIEEQMK